MIKEEKIFLESDKSLKDVLEKIEESKASKIVLDISNDSPLRSSPDNFHILKSRASKLDKKLLIESTDPFIEEMANLAGIDSINPIFGKKESLVSDIIPKADGGDLDDYDKADFFDLDLPKKNKKKERKIRNFKFSLPLPKSKFLLTSGILVLAVLIYVSISILPKATVVVALKETLVEFEQSINISTNVDSVEINENSILFPGEIIKAKKNNQISVLATGEAEDGRRATGEIDIVNELGTSLTLIENTRFESPNGRIYRISERVTVPTSGVRVKVTADEAGEGYNVVNGEDQRWNIPGFKENNLTQEYNNIYANPATSISGGASGLTKVPTEEDIENGKNELKKSLLNSLKSQILVVNSNDFELLDEAIDFRVIEENVNEEVDGEGKFNIFGQAELTVFVFEGEDLNQEIIKANSPDLDFNFKVVQEDITYSDILVDFENESMTFTVTGEMVIKPQINESSFKAQILGKDEGAIRSVIFSIPNLEKADISLWPFWVKSVPSKEKKIELILE
ncbi:MAG: hypothetical protein WD471_00630 [Candidatus Paceibacterota bacterium]